MQQRIALAPRLARTLLLLSIGAYLLLKVYHIDDEAIESVDTALQGWPRMHLQMAWKFPGYFLIALCVAGSILGMRFGGLRHLARVASPVGIVASFTFTIYLTHLPLLKFFVAIGGTTVNSILWPAIATVAFVVAFGLFTERRIGPWRAAFALIVRVGDNLAGRAGVPLRGG
jgi:peptidoglycan/LPS O-acetylase OafA/YrhL